MNLNSRIKCPKCGSPNIYVGKKGFSTGKAVVGGLLTGNVFVAAAAGGIGANKIILTCLECGKEFNIGEGDTDEQFNRHYPSREEIAEFEKHVIPKEEMPEVATYKCPCGKIFTCEKAHPYCPSCGRRMTEKNKPTPEDYKQSGCLSIILVLIVFAITLCWL